MTRPTEAPAESLREWAARVAPTLTAAQWLTVRLGTWPGNTPVEWTARHYDALLAHVEEIAAALGDHLAGVYLEPERRDLLRPVSLPALLSEQWMGGLRPSLQTLTYHGRACVEGTTDIPLYVEVAACLRRARREATP